jgi:hypothetical protein
MDEHPNPSLHAREYSCRSDSEGSPLEYSLEDMSH